VLFAASAHGSLWQIAMRVRNWHQVWTYDPYSAVNEAEFYPRRPPFISLR
jgi:hypothetical protein